MGNESKHTHTEQVKERKRENHKNNNISTHGDEKSWNPSHFHKICFYVFPFSISGCGIRTCLNIDDYLFRVYTFRFVFLHRRRRGPLVL